MQKIITITGLLFVNTFLTVGQRVTDIVDFDSYFSTSNNDFKKNFSFGTYADTTFIEQVVSGGITGGALKPVNSVSGNDVIIYNSNFKNIIDSILETSISFKYDANLINPNQYQHAAAIWLIGKDNHNIGFYLNSDRTLSITSYNYAKGSVLTIQTGRWYKLVAQYKSVGGKFGDEVFAKAEVFDLGVDGKETPTSIGNHIATIFDVDLVKFSEFEIQMSGAKWGGGALLDNFTIKGIKGTTISTGVSYNANLKVINIYPNPVIDILTIKSNQPIKNVTLIDMTGKIIKSTKEQNVDFSYLSTGKYILRINLVSGQIVERLIIKNDR